VDWCGLVVCWSIAQIDVIDVIVVVLTCLLLSVRRLSSVNLSALSCPVVCRLSSVRRVKISKLYALL
jgi:hypothetical protein